MLVLLFKKGGLKMNKEEILAKSRAENKNRDVYELEVSKTANSAAVLVMLIIAGVLFAAQVLSGKGLNFGIWALVFSADMAAHWTKFIKMKRKGELLAAILYAVIVAVLSGYHIYSLIF